MAENVSSDQRARTGAYLAGGDDIKSKIFTVADFIFHIRDDSHSSGFKLKARRPCLFPVRVGVPLAPLSAAYEIHVRAARNLHVRRLETTATDEQVQLRKETLQADIDLSRAMEGPRKHSVGRRKSGI